MSSGQINNATQVNTGSNQHSHMGTGLFDVIASSVQNNPSSIVKNLLSTITP